MKKLFQIAMLLPMSSLAAPTYTVEGELGDQRLVVREGNATFTWSDDMTVGIERQGDFDGDGRPDAIVWSACGGNGCGSPSYAFVSLKDDRLSVLTIGDSIDGLQARQTDGRWFFELKVEGGSEVFVMDGDKPTPYATTKRPVLKALAEVHGPGTVETEGPDQHLSADVDLDGKPESIRCEVWARWGLLWCHLPLPGGGTQQLGTGCKRFGALPTSSNGRREFVCNEDSVVRFDGKAWVEPRLANDEK